MNRVIGLAVALALVGTVPAQARHHRHHRHAVVLVKDRAAGFSLPPGLAPSQGPARWETE